MWEIETIMAHRQLVILGAGGHAVSVANVAVSAGFTIKNFVDISQKGNYLLGYEIIGDVAELENLQQYCFCIAIGDNALREMVYVKLLTQSAYLEFPALIHKNAVISDHTLIGDGTVVMPGVVIGPNTRVGKFCILNTRSSIDHDCILSDYASLAPGAITGGRVIIGNRSAISMGAIIKHAVTVGNDSVVGANSYLHKDLTNNKVAYGSPAKVIRDRALGDAYLD